MRRKMIRKAIYTVISVLIALFLYKEIIDENSFEKNRVSSSNHNNLNESRIANSDRVKMVETKIDGIRSYIVADILDGSVYTIDGYIVYQDAGKKYYLYDPLSMKNYQFPEVVKQKIVHVNHNEAIAIEYRYEPLSVIIHHWSYKINENHSSEYSIEGPFDFDFLDTQYYEGKLYIALSNQKILQIDKEVNVLDIPDTFNHISLNDILVVHDNKLYLIADQDLVYQFDNEANNFEKMIPSPTYVKEQGIYRIEEGNQISISNGEYRSNLTLPAIPEDYSIHHEGSYYLLDSYKNKYIFGRVFDQLYLYANKNIQPISIEEQATSLIGLFVDENRLIYRKNQRLFLLNTDSFQEKEILDLSPTFIQKITETDKAIYFSFSIKSKLYVLEIPR